MGSSIKNQNGFSLIVVLVVVAVVAVAGFVAWRVLNEDSDGAVSKTSVSEEQVPEVSNNSDLEDAENFVNDIDVDGDLNTSDIDNALNGY